MSIWAKGVSLEAMNLRSKNTLADYLGIQFTELGDDYLKATMPVDYRTVQPLRILNGGASCALIETAASTAANACVDQALEYCLGLDINANHLRAVHETSFVTAWVKAIHLGRSTQVWAVDLWNAEGKQSCVARMTMMVIKR